MKIIRILAFASGLLLTAGAVVGLFDPLMGEILGLCGFTILLFIIAAVLIVAAAERGY